MARMQKKTLKRIVLLAVLGLAFILVGCGKKESAKKEKYPTLIWYQIGDKSKDFDKVMKELNKKVEKKLGVKIDMRMISFGDYAKKMQIINASGETYDIAFTARDYNYSDNARKGAYLDVKSLIPKYAPALVDRMQGGKVDVDGKSYGIPTNNIGASNFYWTFNEAMLQKNNISVDGVNSLQSLEPVLKEFQEKNKDANVKYTLAVDQSFRIKENFDFLLSDTIPLGVSTDKDTGKIENFLDLPQAIQDFESMHKYYQAGYINKDVARSTDSSINLSNGNNSWFSRLQESGEIAAGKQGIEQVTGYPVTLKAYTNPSQGINNATVALHTISATSKHPKESLKVLNLLNTDKELAALLVYGIKGVHYNINEDGTVKFTKKQADYNMGAWCLLKSELLPLTTKQTDADKQALADYVKNAKESPALGFFFDTSKVKTEITAVQSVMAQYQTDLNVGATDPAVTIPKVKKELEKAGFDKVQKEAQKQYTAWQNEKK